MSLATLYQRFIDNPSEAALAPGASLNYIPTLTTLYEPAAIVKHLATQAKIVKKKKSDKILSAIESNDGLCVDVEVSLEFISGGGVYLPGLEDNFLADRTVAFPMVHIVHFDSQQKIRQIRLYWDQGSLLKQVEIIGARAKNWPIRDGPDQTKLIVSNTSALGSSESAVSSRPESRSSEAVSTEDRTRTTRSSVSATADPHASLSLFQQPPETPGGGPKISGLRASSAKPPPRDLSELFVSQESAAQASPSKNGFSTKAGSGKNYHPIRLFDHEEESVEGTPEKALSPKKTNTIPVKAGSGKNFQANRLFDEPEESEPGKKKVPEGIKTNPQKFQHFDFGDGEETPKGTENTRLRPRNAKHLSQWDFEDFVTPEKAGQKVRGQDVRHFGWSDDEVEESPVRRPVVHQPRPDSNAHFEFSDKSTPAANKLKDLTNRGRKHSKDEGLYKDHVVLNADDDETPDAKKKSNATKNQFNNDVRKKDFAAHWEMTDESPSTKTSGGHDENTKPIQDKKKTVSSLNPSWGMYDNSPDASKARGIAIAGNGMGGRLGHSWSIGDDGDEENSNTTTKGRAAGINIAGNGMGGRKGHNWSIGDDPNEEDDSTTPVAGRKAVAGQKKSDEKSSFWDF